MKTYGKEDGFLVRQETPFNAGPRLERLVAADVTPNKLFFVRNHGNVPEVDVNAYRLKVSGDVSQPLTLSLAELKKKFQSTTVEATLQCAGNRRSEMAAHKPIPGELPWGAEAISNGNWTGVHLSDVLMAAGVSAEDDLHVEFVGLDDVERHGKQFHFGGSVPIEKAFNREVLLAYEMNGETLPPIHGFPLRAVVPGYIGARSVKWLSEIRVRRGPSENYFQDHAYRLFPPDVNAENVKWETGLMLGQMQLNSVICVPVPEGAAKAGEVTVRGYAVAGGARQVSRVEISTDDGASWREAELEGEGKPWTWRLWTARLKLLPGQHELAVRAVDSGANVQPSEMKQIWNFKGYMANAWHRQSIEVK